MALPVASALDLQKNELRNARVQNLGSAPASPVAGQLYYNTGDNKLYWYNGSTWVDATGGAAAAIPPTIVDAKGDLIVATAADTVARKAVGSDGAFLVAASGQSDGLQWRVIADSDIPSTLFRDSEHTTASHQEMLATADLTDWPRTAALDLNSQRITSLADGTGATDAATVGQLNAVATSIDWKASARLATAAALPANTRTGNVLTASANGALTIDGVAAAVTNRVLVKDEATGANNGLYTVTDAGSGGTPWVLTRATDADADAEVTAGLAVGVTEGTTNADTAWLLTTNDAIVVNTTALVFSPFPGMGALVAGAGLTKTGATVDVGQGTGITVGANDVAIDTAVVVRKYAADVGDGSTTSIVVAHNLGTRDVTVAVRDNSSPFAVQLVEWQATSTNTITLVFAVAPTTNQYRVIVHA